MDGIDRLVQTLEGLDGQGYKAYKRIRGRYDAGAFTLVVDHVQGDPYAEPSRFRALVPAERSGLPEWACRTATRRRAAADFLNRRLHEALRQASSDAGSGKSGELRVLRPGQEVLDRAALAVGEDGAVEARFRVGLPARGRRIKGRAAARLVGEAVPEAVEASLFFDALDPARLREHVETVEDAVAIRDQLPGLGLVAFVADGAHLPRRSGIDDRPLSDADTIPFRAPPSLRVAVDTPHSGPLQGMGVPEGVTLIVGGGYHGKSTFLRAIERGVYDHVPGDGRHRVVTVHTAVKVRAEDGRRVAGTDISNFIGRLPGGDDTTHFHTDNASGSTSQAAAIVEALEVGATALLLDEDTSATNFMIRDARMQRLIAAEHEPITPFIDRARELHEERGVSTVVVVGGSGDYFDVADTVIAMREYVPAEVTAEAREVADGLPTHRESEGGTWSEIGPRRPDPGSLDPRRGRRAVSIRVRARDRVDFGTETVDLAAVEQVVETAQTRAIAHALAWAHQDGLGSARSMADAVEAIMAAIDAEGLDAVHPHGIGELARFRPFELAAFLNRLRTLRTHPGRDT
jgi:predicted ABC-class ATPase